MSRRLSEFLGVALFALALIWLIALVTYEPTDPVWFFTTDGAHAPANFVGRVGAFLSELSFQLFGYAAYLLPARHRDRRLALLLVPDAGCGLHEGDRRRAALRAAPARSSAWCFGSTEVAGKTFHAGGSIGAWLGGGARRITSIAPARSSCC